MRVIVTGSRFWENVESVRRELAKLPAGTTVIHGDCTGADEIAGWLGCEELGFTVVRMIKEPPDYARYGKEAWKGLNERMLASQPIDLVLAFHDRLDDPTQARGTRHMIELARSHGVEVRIFSS
jgi:hypothetical protein